LWTQNIHARPELLQSLLVTDPEALLLVHDEQAEILEPHVLGQQPVRTDQNVDLPGGGLVQDALLLPGLDEPGEHLHPHRERRIALGERHVVLFGEERRGHQ
jgi:hypothetical protein